MYEKINTYIASGTYILYSVCELCARWFTADKIRISGRCTQLLQTCRNGTRYQTKKQKLCI
jgi:hypothetical protein